LTPAIVLASGSASRKGILKNAGIAFEVDPPSLDEAPYKLSSRSRGLSAGETALGLARLKAAEISRRHAGAIVIGADQMLECEGDWFDKPADRAGAAAHIARLAGREHHLRSAVTAFRDGGERWNHLQTATLAIRPLTQSEIERYLDRCGDGILQSVGAYQIEGPGIQLFSAIDGDFFTILGLPLLPLLAFLRREGALP
jgi:septum formation protein